MLGNTIKFESLKVFYYGFSADVKEDRRVPDKGHTKGEAAAEGRQTYLGRNKFPFIELRIRKYRQMYT